MVKKLKKMAEQKAQAPAGMLDGLDGKLANAVKASAQQIWLAGMGAFAKAQEEGGKVFEALVKEGVTLQRKTQTVAEERLGEVTGKMSAMAGEVTSKAGASWDKLESIFESRTAKALAKLGVPGGDDLAALNARITALEAAVTQLGGQLSPSKPAPKAAAKRAPAKAPVKAAPKAPLPKAPRKVVAKAPTKRASPKA